MKLRIKGNTIRLRLSKTEVETLAVSGAIIEQTDFGDTVFLYQVKKEDTAGLKADFVNNQLIVYMPKTFADEWPVNNIISIDNKANNIETTGLYILVEKDFKCIDNISEDQSDNYDNPKAC